MEMFAWQIDFAGELKRAILSGSFMSKVLDGEYDHVGKFWRRSSSTQEKIKFHFSGNETRGIL